MKREANSFFRFHEVYRRPGFGTGAYKYQEILVKKIGTLHFIVRGVEVSAEVAGDGRENNVFRLRAVLVQD